VLVLLAILTALKANVKIPMAAQSARVAIMLTTRAALPVLTTTVPPALLMDAVFARKTIT